MALVVGIDLGTQSVKAVACDERLRVVGEHAVAIATQRPAPDRAEQDPAAWEAALEAAIAGAVGRARAARSSRSRSPVSSMAASPWTRAARRSIPR